VSYPSWEVIVVAGGADGTLDIARAVCAEDERFQAIEQQPKGKNAALNQGLELARGQVIVLLDADSEVSPGWLAALVASLRDGIQATTGDPLPTRSTLISLGERMEHIAAYRIHKRATLQGSGSIAICHEVIRAMDGFCEEVTVGVDWDLDARLLARGVPRTFCPDAVVHTERPATLGEYWRNQVRWRRAHFGSILRLSDHFLRDLVSAVTHLYIYALAWAFAWLALATCVALMAGNGRMGTVLGSLLGTIAAWVLLRRASLAAEVAAYTQDMTWLKLLWVPPLLLCVTLAAILPATLTWKRKQVHFKGPRVPAGENVAN
jgi:cellulose synthase/poly-beta-1,6-N-acetylglucosamine synthase-like glycosyltransferase